MVDQGRQNEQSQATPEIERRSLIQGGLAFAGGALANSVLRGQIASAALPSQMTNNDADQIPLRPLGKTGAQVSIIGLGGYHLGTVQSRELAVRLVQEAVEAGITFLITFSMRYFSICACCTSSVCCVEITTLTTSTGLSFS